MAALSVIQKLRPYRASLDAEYVSGTLRMPLNMKCPYRAFMVESPFDLHTSLLGILIIGFVPNLLKDVLTGRSQLADFITIAYYAL